MTDIKIPLLRFICVKRKAIRWWKIFVRRKIVNFALCLRL